jgi:hypothetical protein
MSDNLIEDEFLNRPDDPELAFLHFERIFRKPLDAQLAELTAREGDAYWDSYNHFMQTYINSVLATVQALDLEILVRWVNNPSEANNDKNFKQMKFDIDAAITLIKVRHAQISRKASVHLESTTREKIRELINKIKLTIEGIQIPLPRKEALMTKLNAFAAEVDRDRTKFEAFGALMIEAAGVAGKMEQKLRPIRKWIDSIAGLIREANEAENAIMKLAAPAKHLQAPAKQLAAPSDDLWSKSETKPAPSDLDNEIPF